MNWNLFSSNFLTLNCDITGVFLLGPNPHQNPQFLSDSDSLTLYLYQPDPPHLASFTFYILVHFWVFCCLFISFLLSLSHKSLHELWLFKNSAACIITQTTSIHHIQPILPQLHWRKKSYQCQDSQHLKPFIPCPSILVCPPPCCLSLQCPQIGRSHAPVCFFCLSYHHGRQSFKLWPNLELSSTPRSETWTHVSQSSNPP